MSFRKILVPLAGVESDSTSIDAALLLAREFEAHVEALYAKTARDENSVGDVIKRTGFMKAGRMRTLFLNRCKSYGIEELGDKATDRPSARFLELRRIEADLIVEHGLFRSDRTFASGFERFSLAEHIDTDRTSRNGSSCSARTAADGTDREAQCNCLEWFVRGHPSRRVRDPNSSARREHSRGHNRQSRYSAAWQQSCRLSKMARNRGEEQGYPCRKIVGKPNIACGLFGRRGGLDHSRRLYLLSHWTLSVRFDDDRNDHTQQNSGVHGSLESTAKAAEFRSSLGEREVTLVYPAHADISLGKISILVPVGSTVRTACPLISGSGAHPA